MNRANGHREVEAHRHVAPAVIGEPVDLLVRLPAAFAEQDLGELEDGRVDRQEAEAVRKRACSFRTMARRCDSFSGRKSRNPLGMRGSMSSSSRTGQVDLRV